MNSVRNSPAVSFRPCDRLISLDGKELETSRFRYSRRNFDREFCHMRFAANRLVSHLESCNTANWSTIRAKFKSRPNSDRYVHTRFLSARSDRELVHYSFWTTVRRQNSWQNGKLETIAWLIEMHIRVIQTRFLFLFSLNLMHFRVQFVGKRDAMGFYGLTHALRLVNVCVSFCFVFDVDPDYNWTQLYKIIAVLINNFYFNFTLMLLNERIFHIELQRRILRVPILIL